MKTNTSIIALILFIAFLGIVFLLDLPAYNKVVFLGDKIAQEKATLVGRQELLAKVEQLKGVYDDYESQLKKVYYILPKNQEIPNLIVQLEALASENGLILEQVDFIKEESKQRSDPEQPQSSSVGYKNINVALKLVGEYPAFTSFLEALEHNVRIADVNSIELSLEKGSETSGFSYDVKLKVYYQ